MLYVHQGKQTSSSFNDHAEALRFQDVCNRLGPAEALRIWEAATPGGGHTVASFIDGHLDVLSGVEKKTIAEYRRARGVTGHCTEMGDRSSRRSTGWTCNAELPSSAIRSAP